MVKVTLFLGALMILVFALLVWYLGHRNAYGP